MQGGYTMKTFRNPVSPFSAPDPFMTYDPVTGYYYALFTYFCPGNRFSTGFCFGYG